MRLKADFDKPARVLPEDARWSPSPQPGVERLMLDRIGEEKARATSIVRYAPDSRFPTHLHDKGEEFLVLDGTFSDQSGDFGPGVYVRNPPGSSHAPWSDGGCTIFVKLRQFDADDLARVVVDPAGAAWQSGPEAGVSRLPLHRHGGEEVRLLGLEAGSELLVPAGDGGAELLVLEGACGLDDGTVLGPWAWQRVPAGCALALRCESGCRLYLKTGHLPA